jgi:hypothetical protein
MSLITTQNSAQLFASGEYTLENAPRTVRRRSLEEADAIRRNMRKIWAVPLASTQLQRILPEPTRYSASGLSEFVSAKTRIKIKKNC